jgi:hypothetical protein
MTKLLKASTARKRASEVDLVALELSNIAEDIATVVARGGFSLATGISKTVEKEVVASLEKAGYSVYYPEYENYLSSVHNFIDAKKNWFQRLLDRWFGESPVPVTVIPGNSPYETVLITWEAADPPVDGELA